MLVILILPTTRIESFLARIRVSLTGCGAVVATHNADRSQDAVGK
jgi:hypothetical protein